MNIQKSEGTDNFEQESNAAQNPFFDAIFADLRKNPSKNLWKQKLIETFQGKPYPLKHLGSAGDYILGLLPYCPAESRDCLIQAIEELIQDWDVLREESWKLEHVLDVIKSLRPLSGFSKVVELFHHDALLDTPVEGSPGINHRLTAIHCLECYRSPFEPADFDIKLPTIQSFSLDEYRRIMESQISHPELGEYVRDLLQELEEDN